METPENVANKPKKAGPLVSSQPKGTFQKRGTTMMKTSRILMAAAGVALAVHGAPKIVDPFGNVGMVEFYDCGGKYCGRLVRSFDKAGKQIKSPHDGKNIVAGMADEGGGKFSGGTIWDPGADKTYKSKMQLDGKTLNVSGCVAVFCKTQQWVRVK